MIRLNLLLLILFIFSISAHGQQQNQYHRQFLFNPYLFNPAYAGINNTPELNIAYKQQWSNFKDAPVGATMTFQTPMSDRVAMGLTINSYKQVLLSNNSFNVTFGYILPISKQQSLRFGLSGGLGVNRLDMTVEEMNNPDPVIRNAASSNTYIDGNFGMVYSVGALRLGFSLPKLFNSDAFSTTSFNQFEVSNLKNKLFSASYKFFLDMDQHVSLEPYVLYRQSNAARQNYFEIATVANYKDLFWTGLSFNQRTGIALFTGINVKNRFRLNYGYEFPAMRSSAISASSHEIQLSIRFNRKKSTKLVHSTAKPTMKHLANDVKVDNDERIARKYSGNKNPRSSNPDNTITFDTESDSKANEQKIAEAERRAPLTESKALNNSIAAKEPETFTINKRHHYVVVAVFSVLSRSMKFTKEMIQKGQPVNVILNPKNGFYYVYIYSSTTLEATRRFRNEYKLRNLFKEAWIFTPEE